MSQSLPERSIKNGGIISSILLGAMLWSIIQVVALFAITYSAALDQLILNVAIIEMCIATFICLGTFSIMACILAAYPPSSDDNKESDLLNPL